VEFYPADVFIHFSAAFHADGDGVYGGEIEDIVNGVLGVPAQVATADDFHAVDAGAGFVHAFEDKNNFFRGAVHVFSGVVDAGEEDVRPGGFGGAFEGAEVVAGDAVRPDDTGLFFVSRRPITPAWVLGQSALVMQCMRTMSR